MFLQRLCTKNIGTAETCKGPPSKKKKREQDPSPPTSLSLEQRREKKQKNTQLEMRRHHTQSPPPTKLVGREETCTLQAGWLTPTGPFSYARERATKAINRAASLPPRTHTVAPISKADLTCTRKTRTLLADLHTLSGPSHTQREHQKSHNGAAT